MPHNPPKKKRGLLDSIGHFLFSPDSFKEMMQYAAIASDPHAPRELRREAVKQVMSLTPAGDVQAAKDAINLAGHGLWGQAAFSLATALPGVPNVLREARGGERAALQAARGGYTQGGARELRAALTEAAQRGEHDTNLIPIDPFNYFEPKHAQTLAQQPAAAALPQPRPTSAMSSERRTVETHQSELPPRIAAAVATKDGKVIGRGRSHEEAIRNAGLDPENLPSGVRADQFEDTHGHVHTREQALKIAKGGGQMRSEADDSQLYSENMQPAGGSDPYFGRYTLAPQNVPGRPVIPNEQRAGLADLRDIEREMKAADPTLRGMIDPFNFYTKASSEGGVARAAAERPRLRAAVKLGGKDVIVGQPGEAHSMILDRWAYDNGHYDEYGDIDTHHLSQLGFEDGFVTPDGKFLNREQALKWGQDNNAAISPNAGNEGRLQSQDLLPELSRAERRALEEKILNELPLSELQRMTPEQLDRAVTLRTEAASKGGTARAAVGEFFDRTAPKLEGTLDTPPELIMPDPKPKSKRGRTLSPLVQAIVDDPASVQQVLREDIQRGLPLGEENWYELGPVKQAFDAEAGPGDMNFGMFNVIGGASSARNSVPAEIAVTSILNYMRKTGKPLNEAVSDYMKFSGSPDKPSLIPGPSGHERVLSQLDHPSGLLLPSDPWSESWKTPKYSWGRRGGRAVALDAHERRRIWQAILGDPRLKAIADESGATAKATAPPRAGAKPVPLERAQIPFDNAYDYQAIEDALYNPLAKEFGLFPTGAQERRWRGGAAFTGVDTAVDQSFPQLLEGQLLSTLQRRGIEPTWKNMNTLFGEFVRGTPGGFLVAAPPRF